MITTQDWIDFFAQTTEGVRPDQEKAVNFILNRLAEGKEDIFFQGPVGCGKSWAIPASGAGIDVDPLWYNMQAVIGLVQGSGRAVRCASDVNPSYILDAGWPWFYMENWKLFPAYRRDARRNFLT